MRAAIIIAAVGAAIANAQPVDPAQTTAEPSATAKELTISYTTTFPMETGDYTGAFEFIVPSPTPTPVPVSDSNNLEERGFYFSYGPFTYSFPFIPGNISIEIPFPIPTFAEGAEQPEPTS